MHLVHIVPSLETRHGGPSSSVPALAAACAEIGHEVGLFATTPGAAATRTEGRLTTTTFTRGWPGMICPSVGLRTALAGTSARVIHHHSLWLRTLHYAHLSAAALGARFVLSPRGMMSPWAWRHHRWRKALASRFVHPGALAAVHGWHVTSVEEAAEVRALGFKQPVCIAPNGVREPAAGARDRAAAYWHHACPATRQRPVALFYSRFHRKKRVLELIDLWLRHAPPDWLLLLVGIPQEYTPEELQRHVLRASGGDRVQVFSGIDCPPPYAVASLFLLPSHSENFGLVVAEAMAHGVPALVTDGTPWRGINTDRRGWCVPWADYGGVLHAATAESPAELQARGARARAWVLREFSWEKSARDLVEFYRQLQESRP